MVPFYILITAWPVLRVGGRIAGTSHSWAAAGRAALCVMFVFTGVTHFTSMAHDYLAMVPAALPRSLTLIYLTGGLEILGAVGLLLPAARRWAGLGLTALLIAMFPANVNAALQGIPFRGAPPTPLMLRTAVQAGFLAAVWWTAIRRAAS